MDLCPRLATTGEKADLAMLLAKRRYPHYPFVSPDEIERVVKQIVFQAAITVLEDRSAGRKQMVVHWHDHPTQPECLTWCHGVLESAPAWDLRFDEPPF